MELLTSVIEAIRHLIPDYIVDVIIVVASVVVVLYWAYPYLFHFYKVVKNFWARFHNLLGIAEEFKNNGGSSIRDAIDRIEKNVIAGRDDISILAGKINSIYYVVGKESNIAVIEANRAGEIIYSCRRWTEMTGLSLEETRNYGWQNAVFEEDRNKVVQDWEDAIEDKREFYVKYSIFNRVNNEIIPVESYSLIIRDSQGQPIRYLIVVAPCENSN